MSLPISPTRSTALRVLLVEDSLFHQKLAVGLLSRMGHRVSVMRNGQEAVRAVSDGDYDVVLMDVEMPVMDGLSATRAIRTQEESAGGHVPIVAITSTHNPDECLGAGMDAFLSKPFDARALDSVLHRVRCHAAA